MSSDDENAVRAAVDGFCDALNAMLNGDPNPLKTIYSHAGDVTYLPAEGGIQVGWDAVFADWKPQAGKSLGGAVEISDVHIVIGQDVAIAHNITHGHVKGADGPTVEISLRESSAFRKENGSWKMIAHHADDFKLWEGVVGRSS
jgi:ketosteroid isomerase-like protein